VCRPACASALRGPNDPYFDDLLDDGHGGDMPSFQYDMSIDSAAAFRRLRPAVWKPCSRSQRHVGVGLASHLDGRICRWQFVSCARRRENVVRRCVAAECDAWALERNAFMAARPVGQGSRLELVARPPSVSAPRYRFAYREATISALRVYVRPK